MLLKNIKKINIFSFKIPKRNFPRISKSINNNKNEEINGNEFDEESFKEKRIFENVENIKINNEIDLEINNNYNNNKKLGNRGESFTKSLNNLNNKIVKNKKYENTNSESEDIDIKQLPELSQYNNKKIFVSEEEQKFIKLGQKVSKNMERISDPSDEDAHFTGEDVNEIDYDSYFDLYYFARLNNKLPHIPSDIQEMAKKVFSKHSFKDIKFWTEKFLLNYSQNHACEPPIDLSNLPTDAPKLANSEELNIKIKLFKQLDLLNDKEKGKSNLDKSKNDNSELDSNSTSKNQVKLDKYHTIDLEDERKLNKEKEHINPIKVVYNQAQVVAYLYSRMPYTYQVCKRVLNEVLFRMPNFKPKSVLDFGAGLGSAVWATFHTYEGMITKYAAVEPNRDMRRLGKFLTSTINTDILWVESITMIPGAGIERGKFDIIFLSHVLQEISTSKLRLMILETLWNRLSNDGILIIVEPGSPKGFRFITDIRKWVIEKGREDANIVAPCPHHFDCPLAKKASTWCHFSQLSYKFDKDIITKTQKEKQIFNEKFTYLTIKKGKIPSSTHKNEQETKTPEEKSFFWERIIRPVIAKHKHRIVDLCTKRGKFERRVISKSHGGAGGYKTIKKFNWGDLWYVPLWLPNKFRKERLRGKRLW